MPFSATRPILLALLICAAVAGTTQSANDRLLGQRLLLMEHRLDSVLLADANTVASQAVDRSTDIKDPVPAIIAQASPAVVSIIISKHVDRPSTRYDDFFGDDLRRYFFERSTPSLQEVGAGTGFFLSSDGYILTNRHVVDDTEAEYTVVLSDGAKRPASVMYRDDAADIAVLKIEGSDYATIPLGDSSALKIGQTVAAIGNALGEYDNSVSVGIVSGLDRTVQAQSDTGGVETLRGVIQTDAAINLGNSGGPLLDLSGRVIGVTVAIQAAAANIAFAIPIDVVRSVLEKAMK